MPGCMVHIAVADKIAAGRLGADMAEPEQFLAGNIAPDAIHAREGFTRDMKRHTHLKDGIHDKDFLSGENTKAFYQRLENFIEKYCRRKQEKHDLYCGYVSHLLTDRLFIETVREDFVRDMKKLGVEQNDMEFFRKISFDLDNIDARISAEYKFENQPAAMLRKADCCDIGDLLAADEVKRSRGWVLWNFFSGGKQYETPVFIPYEKVMDFIETAAVQVSERLTGYGLY